MQARLAAFVLALTIVLVTSARAEDDAAPPPASLTDAVHRFVSAHADASACTPQPAVRGEARWQCRVTECPGACRVVHVVTVLGERRGRWRRVSQAREDRGDTGECGCCMGGL